MKIYALLFSLLYLLSGCSTGCTASRFHSISPSVESLNVSEVLEKTKRSVVHVYSYAKPEDESQFRGMSSGTGVMVGLDSTKKYVLVLSDWHILWDRNQQSKSGASFATRIVVSPVVEPPEERMWRKGINALPICFDARWDIVLLAIEEAGVKENFGLEEGYIASVSLEDPPVGMEVWTIGNSDEFHQILSKGIVAGYQVKENTRGLYPRGLITDTSVWKGGSGGISFAPNGAVVGVVTRTSTAARWAFNTPASDIWDFINRCQAEVADLGSDLATTRGLDITDLREGEFIIGSPKVISPHYEEFENPIKDEGTCGAFFSKLPHLCPNANPMCLQSELDKLSEEDQDLVKDIGSCAELLCVEELKSGRKVYSACLQEWCDEELAACNAPPSE